MLICFQTERSDYAGVRISQAISRQVYKRWPTSKASIAPRGQRISWPSKSFPQTWSCCRKLRKTRTWPPSWGSSRPRSRRKSGPRSRPSPSSPLRPPARVRSPASAGSWKACSRRWGARTRLRRRRSEEHQRPALSQARVRVRVPARAKSPCRQKV